MQKNAEAWRAVELAKRDQVISDLSSLVEAKDEATAQLNDEFTVHVEELVCHNNPGKTEASANIASTIPKQWRPSAHPSSPADSTTAFTTSNCPSHTATSQHHHSCRCL